MTEIAVWFMITLVF